MSVQTGDLIFEVSTFRLEHVCRTVLVNRDLRVMAHSGDSRANGTHSSASL